MEKEGYYIAVGAFVILAVGLLIVFIAIISGREPQTETRRYEVVFTGSVSGLDVGSDVRYLGVKVGKVVSIRLVPDKPREVSVIIEVDGSVPIYGNTIAKLKLQGITGISMIELSKEGPGREPLGEYAPGGLPRIKAADSDLEKLAQNLPELLDSADEVMDRITDVLNDQNIARFGNIMRELEQASEALPEVVDRLDATLREYQRTAEATRPGLVQVLARLNEVAEELEAITRRTDELYAHNSAALNSALSSGGQDIERLLEESRYLLAEVRRLTRRIEENPALLVSQPVPRGVEFAP